MSKSSRQRPTNLNKFRSNYDAIFRKPNPKEVEDARAEDEAFKIIEEKQSQVRDTKQGG
jgi:inhibitor of KinA sporulation pathway (predicted exonuclease)